MGLQACINATLTFLSSRAKREEADATESESRDLAVLNPVLWNSLRRGTALAVPYSSEKERARLAASPPRRASGKRSATWSAPSPEGAIAISPPLQRRVADNKNQSPVGTADSA